MRKFLLFQKAIFFVLLLSAPFLSIAQQIIKGKIQTETGEVLPGATIAVKGRADVQTKAAADGTFSIAANANDILVISNIGYEGLEVPAKNASFISLRPMQEI
jgi:iron complex outermembrane receptor protein